MGATVVTTKAGAIAFRVRWTPPGGRKRRYQFRSATAATPEALASAYRQAAEMGERIRRGVFDPHDFFEFEDRFGRPERAARGETLAVRMRTWIDENEALRVRRSRLRDYRSHLKNYIAEHPIGSHAPADLAYEDFRSFKVWLLSEAGMVGRGVSEKTAASVMRQTLRAFLRDAGLKAPLEELERIRWERYEPTRRQDPFTPEERDALCTWFRSKRPFGEYVSIRLRFRGVTPSEVRGLRVGDYDRATATLRIERSEHLGSIGATKTRARDRIVGVGDLAVELATATGIRHPDEQLLAVAEDTLRDNFAKAQTALGFRHRSLYQAKHTYAVNALLEGSETPAEVARGLGISLATLEKYYAAWLRKGHRGVQVGRAIGRTS